MVTPTEFLRQGPAKAFLQIEQPKLPEAKAIIPVKFNPTEYQIQKQNNFAEIAIPGLETPPIQFIRGASAKLSTELLVDTSDTLEDVRAKYVDGLSSLLNIQPELHAPPIVQLHWDKEVFRGVVESLSITYTMFRPDGVPLRAKLSLTLKEYRPVDIQIKERDRHSPDVEKSYTVGRGDTLAGIAFKVYRRADVWREIARANDIRDPRRLDPGRVLRLPKLSTSRKDES